LLNWNKIFEKIVNFVIPIEVSPEERSKRLSTLLVLVLTLPLLIGFSFLRFSTADYLLGVLLLLVAISVTISSLIGRTLEDATRLYGLNMAFVGFLFLYLIGTSGSNPYYVFWSFLFPLEAFYLLGLRLGSLFTSVFYMIAVCLILFQEPFHGTMYHDHQFKTDFVLALLVLLLMAYSFAKIKKSYELGLKERQLALETERAELKKAQDKLLTFNERLENQVLERTEALRKANTQLKEEVRARLLNEEALRENEENYRLHFENISDAIYTINSNLKIEMVSPSAVNILGVSAKSLIGKSILKAKILAPEYQEKAISEIKQVLGGKRILASEYEFIFEGRRRLFGEISSSPLIKNNEIIGVISVMRDITERKMVEEELRQAHKMEAIGTLAGGIAHEFNNILGIILGNAELAVDDVPDWNPARESLKEICTACLRAKEVVRQILSFARKTMTAMKPLEINTIVKESLKLMRASIPTMIDIHQNIPSKSLMILGDPTEIHQIVINLCTNAAHAMKMAQGILEVDISEVSLDKDEADRHEELVPGDFVKLTVKDSGEGIAPDVLEKVFEPYFTTKEFGAGSGMGLAVVYGLVKKCKGAIHIKSTVGEGTTVEILFPKIEEEAPPAEIVEGELPTGNEKILLVDDDPSIVTMIRQMLERLGYTVSGMTDSVAALERFQSTPDDFDLLITDMAMPNMSGDQLAAELIKARKDFPILLCTGHSDTIDEKRAKQLGIRGFAMKPLDKGKLARAVRAVLDGR